MVVALQLDSWWADVLADELTSNLLKAVVPLIWWISYQRRRAHGIALPPARVGRGRAWLEAAVFTLSVAAVLMSAGSALREPYDLVRYPLEEGARTQIAWVSSRLGRALFQQAGLQLFVWPVARELVGGGLRAVAFSATVFALLHVPYPLLVAATFVFGWVWVSLFRRGRSLVALVLSHAILAMVVFAVIPDRVSHNLHVGRFEMENGWGYRRLAEEETRELLRAITSEEYYRRSGAENEAWLTAVYLELSGEAPGTEESRAWSRQLETSPREEVAKRLVLAFARQERQRASGLDLEER